jgi:hypothetical protein
MPSCNRQVTSTSIHMAAWSLMRARAALGSVVAGLGGQDVLVATGWDSAASAGSADEALDGAAGGGPMNLVTASAANTMARWPSMDSRWW